MSLMLSIIVPVYNAEKYLTGCLDSLLMQDVSYTEYEILCIDDGSTDLSPSILDRYANAYENFRVIHKQNQGVSATRNLGIDLAKGRYLWFVDSDDCIQCNALSRILEVLRQYTPELLRMGWERVPGDFTIPLNQTHLLPEKWCACDDPIASPRYVWCAIIQKELILDHGIKFREDMKYCEDTLFMCQVYLYLTKAVPYFKVPIYYYRDSIGAVTSKDDFTSRDQKVTDFMKVIEFYRGCMHCVEANQSKLALLLQREEDSRYVLLGMLPGSTLSRSRIHEAINKYDLIPIRFKYSLPLKVTSAKEWIKNKMLFKSKPLFDVYIIVFRWMHKQH